MSSGCSVSKPGVREESWSVCLQLSALEILTNAVLNAVRSAEFVFTF